LRRAPRRGTAYGQNSRRSREFAFSTIGFALDAGKQKDQAWAPISESYQPIRKWLVKKRPDVLFIIYIYNDHVTSFFFDHYSHFVLGNGFRI
jgi:gallate dioxygenase